MQTNGIARTKANWAGRRGVLQATIADRKHVRVRRRFRLNYPDEVVECAVLLSCLLGVRKTALALDLRLSTVYRWFNKHRTRRSQFVVQLVEDQSAQSADAPRSMIVRCADKSVTSHPYILSKLRGMPQQTTTDFESEYAPATPDPTSVEPRGVVESEVGQESTAAASHRHLASERILSTKTLIDCQYWSDWSCAKLASVVGISKFQFINEFSATFGKSPYHYLLGVRVYHATELVKQRSDRTLAEIARSVGFGSSSSMRRAFKNFLGASPANFVNRFGLSDSLPKPNESTSKAIVAAGTQARRTSEIKTVAEHPSVVV